MDNHQSKQTNPAPIHILSLGAGVQSSTLALMAAHGEVTPMPKCAVFADTQDEPKSVYVWLDWLEKQLPYPVYRVTAGKLSDRELLSFRSGKSGKVYRKSGIPFFIKNPDTNVRHGIFRRQCTSDFKIDPIIKKIKEIASIPRGCKTVRVIQWLGISRDEIIRMKPARYPYILHHYPLIDQNIRRSDCLKWMEAHEYPRPPRSACYYCPYHNDTEWLRIKQDEPEYFQKAVEFERAVQQAEDEVCRGIPFLHASCVPLDEVDLEADKDNGQLNLFGAECEGMCGV